MKNIYLAMKVLFTISACLVGSASQSYAISGAPAAAGSCSTLKACEPGTFLDKAKCACVAEPDLDAVKQIINRGKSESAKKGKPGSVAARVHIHVSGHWPLNGNYTFGSAGLTCAALLGPGETFPSGVSCSN